MKKFIIVFIVLYGLSVMAFNIAENYRLKGIVRGEFIPISNYSVSTIDGQKVKYISSPRQIHIKQNITTSEDRITPIDIIVPITTSPMVSFSGEMEKYIFGCYPAFFVIEHIETGTEQAVFWHLAFSKIPPR